MCRTASSKRCSMRASSPSIASRRTCSHGSSTVSSQCSTWSRAAAARTRSPAEIAALAANSQFAAWSHGRSSPRRARCCDRSAPAPARTRRGATRRRRGSRRSAPAGRRRRSRRPARRRRRRARARARDGPSTPRSSAASSSAPARSRGRGGVAGGVERRQDPLRAAAVAEDDPGPAEPVDDGEREQRVVRRAPGQGGVDVGALGPGEGEVLGLAGRCARPRSTRPRPAANQAACAARRALGQPGLRHRVERERADAVEQPVADGAPRRRRSRASGSRAARPRRSPPTPGTSSASRTDSTAASGAPPANVASAHRPRWSSGNSSS